MKCLSKILFIVFFCLVVNGYGQSITWEKIYDNPGTSWDGINAICESDSGNFFLVGFTLVPTPMNHYKIWVIKINSLGDTLWSRTLGRDGSQGYSAVSSGDGGCVITGSAGQAFTIKVDKNGNTIWERYYGGLGVQCKKIRKTSDNGFIACGRIDLQHGYIFKVDTLGFF